MKKKFVIYLRVSTEKQGESRLGLDAQKKDCSDFVKSQNGEIVAEFTDIQSGKSTKRRKLLVAIDFCKENECALVVAKLDRLARNTEFVFHIVNTGIEIFFCDLPVVNTMILGVFASVAQYERELTSDRTKKALKVSNSNGVYNGRKSENYTINTQRQEQGRKIAAKTKNANVIHSDETAAFCTVLSRNVPVLAENRTPEPLFFLKWDNICFTLDKGLAAQIIADCKDFYKHFYKTQMDYKWVCNRIIRLRKSIKTYKELNDL